jgi:hypothetical protein
MKSRKMPTSVLFGMHSKAVKKIRNDIHEETHLVEHFLYSEFNTAVCTRVGRF